MMEQIATSPTTPAASPNEITEFTPVPLRTHKGWTPARQKAFIEILAQTASVKRASAAVNMSPVSCYYLRKLRKAQILSVLGTQRSISAYRD